VVDVREPGLAYAVPLIDRLDLVRVDEVQGRTIGYTTAPGSLLRTPVYEEALHVTADENVIDLHVEIQYRVGDAVRYALGVERPGQVLSALVRSRLIEAMAAEPIDLVYTRGRADLEERLLARARDDVGRADLGIDVVTVRLLDVHAPADVHDAFRDVASAHEDRLTTIHLATEYAVGTVALARGEARRTIVDAQAWALEREARAGGDADAFRALAAAHARAPKLMEDRLYIETAERVLAGARKIVRATTSTPTGFELWIRGRGAPQLFPPPPGSQEQELP
jgi:membrane protease subunit HflK